MPAKTPNALTALTALHPSSSVPSPSSRAAAPLGVGTDADLAAVAGLMEALQSAANAIRGQLTPDGALPSDPAAVAHAVNECLGWLGIDLVVKPAPAPTPGFVLPPDRGHDTVHQFLADTLCTAHEAAWGWFAFHRVKGRPWYWNVKDTMAPTETGWGVRVTTLDDDGDRDPGHEPVIVGHDEMLAAIRTIATSPEQIGLHPDRRAEIVGAFYALDAGRLDADLADVVLQVAVLGEVVFG